MNREDILTEIDNILGRIHNSLDDSRDDMEKIIAGVVKDLERIISNS